MVTMTNRYESDFARRYFARGEEYGRAGGEAAAIVAFLVARGIDVPDAARNEILSCRDFDQLDVWVRRAANATTVDELFI